MLSDITNKSKNFDLYMNQTVRYAKSKVLKNKINDLNLEYKKIINQTNEMIDITQKLTSKNHCCGNGLNAVRFLK
jgi:hypothetical protein